METQDHEGYLHFLCDRGLTQLFLQTFWRVHTGIIPILQMSLPDLDIESNFLPGQQASVWRSQDANENLSDSGSLHYEDHLLMLVDYKSTQCQNLEELHSNYKDQVADFENTIGHLFRAMQTRTKMGWATFSSVIQKRKICTKWKTGQTSLSCVGAFLLKQPVLSLFPICSSFSLCSAE